MTELDWNPDLLVVCLCDVLLYAPRRQPEHVGRLGDTKNGTLLAVVSAVAAVSAESVVVVSVVVTN